MPWVKAQKTNPEVSGYLGSVGRQLGLGTRNMLEGMAGLADIPNMAVNALGGNLAYPSQMLGQGLTAIGLPQPETNKEQIYGAMQRGGGAAMAGMGATGILANPLTQMASGMAGAGGAEIAKQSGAGPLGQLGAGVLGGALPFPISAGLGATASLGRELARPLTVSGRDTIAGRVMNDLAVDPQAAMLRSEANQGRFLGKPTMGQASQDIGLLGAEKSLKAQNPVDWAIREEEQNLARQTLMGKVSGTENVVKRIESLRDQATSKLRNAAFAEQQANGPVDTAAIDEVAKQILGGTNRKRSVVTRAISDIRNKLTDTKTVDAEQVKEYVTDAQTLYGVRKEINDKLAGLSETPTDRLAAKELLAIKEALDIEISKVAPSWGNYLSEYHRYSQKIDRLNELQGIAQKTANAVQTSQGTDIISRVKWATQVSKRVKDLKPMLTTGQMRNLDKITEDLQRTASPPELRQPGSDTFSNLSVANVLGNMISNRKWVNNPAVKQALKPLGYLYTLPDRAVIERISEAMLDPALARKLMQPATDENIRTFGAIFKSSGTASALGASYGLLGNQ